MTPDDPAAQPAAAPKPPAAPKAAPAKPPKEPDAWPQPARFKQPTRTEDLERLQSRFKGAIDAVGDMSGMPVVYVKSASVMDVLRFARWDLHFEHCSFVSAVDYNKEGFFEIHWQLYHYPADTTTPGRDLVVKTTVPRDEPLVPSVTSLWTGTNWHEREAYDLFGIVFEGHPDLTRIFMPEGWRGHPLRKDYDRSPQYIGMNDRGEDVVYDTPGPYRW